MSDGCAGANARVREACERPTTRLGAAAEHAEIDDQAAFLGTLTDGCDASTDSADPARNTPAN